MENKPISKLVIAYAIFQIIALALFSLSIISGRAAPSLVGQQEATLLFGTVTIRHLAVAVLILIGLIHKSAAILFGSFVVRFVMDAGDYIWRVILTGSSVPARGLIVIFFISLVVFWIPQILCIRSLQKNLKSSH